MQFFRERLPVKFLGTFEIPRTAGWMHTKHLNTYFAISIRLEGHAEFHTEGERITVEPGEVLVIPPGKVYSQYTDGETIQAIHLEVMDRLGNSRLEKIKTANWVTVKDLFSKIYEIDSKRESGWYYKASAKVYELLSILQQEAEIQEPSAKEPVEIGIDYLEAHYADSNVSVSEAAEKAGYSEAYFRKCFLAKYGITPSQRIQELRLEKAKRLLEARANTIAEVSELVGISEPKYFSTWFRKQTGMSPRDYVDALRG